MPLPSPRSFKLEVTSLSDIRYGWIWRYGGGLSLFSKLLTFDDVDLNRVMPGVAGVAGVVTGVRRRGEGQDEVAPPGYLTT